MCCHSRLTGKEAFFDSGVWSSWWGQEASWKPVVFCLLLVFGVRDRAQGFLCARQVFCCSATPLAKQLLSVDEGAASWVSAGLNFVLPRCEVSVTR